ncbi:MAG: TolB-like protein [Cognaticolwellia sp.]|jgi:TolB-like protein
MKYKILFLCTLLSGCAEIPDKNANVSDQMNQDKVALVETQKSKYDNRYYGDELIKNVNHYAKWLTQDLFANIDFPNNNDVFVVANFALLDSKLNKTSHFGRQMTEAMIHEVHRTGFSVIDMKASGFIRMTETGDIFYESTDYRELSTSANASHVITGTLTKHQGGYFVNAKVVLLENNALVSSAQIFVPYDVVDAVMLEEKEIKEITLKKTTLTLRAYSK